MENFGFGLLSGGILGSGIAIVVMAMLTQGASVDKMLEFLKGKKTYLIVAVGVAVFGGEQVGIFPAGTSDKIDVVLGILGIGTLRAAITNEKRNMLQGK